MSPALCRYSRLPIPCPPIINDDALVLVKECAGEVSERRMSNLNFFTVYIKKKIYGITEPFMGKPGIGKKFFSWTVFDIAILK
jgi:hypothetical protein